MANLFPRAELIELPILQELIATSGVEDVRFLYQRLTPYFLQLVETFERGKIIEDEDVAAHWRKLVQRAGRSLADKKHITRQNGRWTITAVGRRRAQNERLQFELAPENVRPAELQHADVQQMLVEIGNALGFHAAREHDYYDVVWRTRANNSRLSHVFEVQRRGNMDSALAKLKRAYDAQRSKTYLVLTSERDMKRALKSVDARRNGAFQELYATIEIISFEQLAKLHKAVTLVRELLPSLIER